jgi:hypothetical protein
MFQLTPTKIVDLLVFLEESRIPFTPPPNDVLAAALVKEIDNPMLSPSLLESLGLFDVVQSIPMSESTAPFLNLAKMKSLIPGTTLRTCNKAFKAFCGPENLTPTGMITRDRAMTLIKAYIERCNLSAERWIHLDDTLRSALTTDLSHSTNHKLIELVESVFQI